MLTITWKQAAAWRVWRHHLAERVPAKQMLAVASRLCGLHAQVLSCAELTLWARTEGLGRDAVRRALWDDRTLVKTWAMRGTLHLLPAHELPLWHAALSKSPRYLRESVWQSFYGISLDELDQITNAIGIALPNRILTREQIAAEVQRITGSAKLGEVISASSWGSVLKPAAFMGRLCFAPSEGQRVCFTHPASWLKKQPGEPPPSNPEPEIARRFLSAFGPATAYDLARWWNGGQIGNARQWLATLGDEVTEIDVEGTRAWMLSKHVKALTRERPRAKTVRLLPGFDQYVIAASHHAEHLLQGAPRARVYRPQGWISPVLLVNGFVHGTWRHEIKGSGIDVVIEPFAKCPQWVRRAAALEAERLAAYFGATLRLKLTAS